MIVEGLERSFLDPGATPGRSTFYKSISLFDINNDMDFSQFYHKTNALDESTSVLDQMSGVHNLHDFLSQHSSPYILLQILVIALIPLTEFPANSLEELDQNPKLLLMDSNRKKMQFLMKETRFSNDFSALYRKVFPEALANPMEWAKKNRELSTNIKSPEIQQIISTLVQHYKNIK